MSKVGIRAAALAALTSVGCDLVHSCTEIGCQNGFSWLLESPLGVAELATAQIEACHPLLPMRQRTVTCSE